MTNQNDIDIDLDALFRGAVMVSTVRAFTALGIGKDLGHELINAGLLERVHIGRASRITVASIRRVAKNGVPLGFEKRPPIKRPS